MKRAIRRGALLAAGALVFVGALAIGRRPPASAATPEPQRGGPYRPAAVTREGTELVLVYIGSSGCVPSNHEDLPGALEQLKVRLRDRADGGRRGFATVGIARDWVVDEGLAHLRKYGSFDEVMAGRNWMNAGVRRYVWEEIPGEASTPQVLVVERAVGDVAARGIQYGTQGERLVVRKVGTDEILAWAQQGAPLPELAAVSPARGP
ncbi:MAG: hypothetical protein KY464_13105 [Gemmatimonadetes bacterium]|nr:hypothetical protein [Gemmatimonadota bacterium]